MYAGVATLSCPQYIKLQKYMLKAEITLRKLIKFLFTVQTYKIYENEERCQ